MAEIIPIEPARIIPGREMIARLFYGPATIRFAGRILNQNVKVVVFHQL